MSYNGRQLPTAPLGWMKCILIKMSFLKCNNIYWNSRPNTPFGHYKKVKNDLFICPEIQMLSKMNQVLPWPMLHPPTKLHENHSSIKKMLNVCNPADKQMNSVKVTMSWLDWQNTTTHGIKIPSAVARSDKAMLLFLSWLMWLQDQHWRWPISSL